MTKLFYLSQGARAHVAEESLAQLQLHPHAAHIELCFIVTCTCKMCHFFPSHLFTVLLSYIRSTSSNTVVMAGTATKLIIDFTSTNILAGAQELSFACGQLKSVVKLLTAASDTIKKLPVSKQVDVLSRLDSRHVSLYFVSTLTLNGVDTIRMANSLVPAKFADRCFKVITRIVRQHCNMTGISEED